MILLAVIAAWLVDLPALLELSALQQAVARFAEYHAAHPVLTVFCYCLISIVLTGASLPAVTVLMLSGGALFGFWVALVAFSFSSTIGATIAFLLARGFLRDWVERRFGRMWRAVEQGVDREGAFYLFGLRMVPIFPFFVINAAAGLTRLPVWTFYWVTQLGMLPVMVVYINAGTRLGEVRELADIFSPVLLISFALIGVLPWLAKHAMDMVRRRRDAG